MSRRCSAQRDRISPSVGCLQRFRTHDRALGEDGRLTLTRDTSQGFDVLSQVALLKKVAWTPMTRSGTETLRA
jgi:hypothetical protein